MKELQTVSALINSFSKLPGVGVKSAERMAYADFSDAARRHPRIRQSLRRSEQKSS
jgi:recombinational DNA repair protein RecR